MRGGLTSLEQLYIELVISIFASCGSSGSCDITLLSRSTGWAMLCSRQSIKLRFRRKKYKQIYPHSATAPHAIHIRKQNTKPVAPAQHTLSEVGQVAVVVQGAEVVQQLERAHERFRGRRVHEVEVHLQRGMVQR